MNKILLRATLNMQAKTKETKEKIVTVLKNKEGISETTEKLLWTASAAALVLIVAGLFIVLVKTDLFPELGNKLKELFNLA